MPVTPATAIGAPETLVSRVTATLDDVVGVRATANAPTGVRVDVAVSADWGAAATESMAALIAHMIEATRHPAVTTFLMHYRDQIGL